MALINELKIISNDGGFAGSEIFMNGKPFPCISLKLKGNAGEIWRCKVEFFVKEIDIINKELMVLSEGRCLFKIELIESDDTY